MVGDNNKYPLTDNSLWILLNDRDNIQEVVKYIKRKRPDLFLDSNDLIEYASSLLERGYDRVQILNGLADDDIASIIKLEEHIQRSVRRNDEAEKYVPLRPRKEKNLPVFFKKLILTGLACATIVTSFASIHKKMIRDDIDYKTSIYIGMLASELGSEDYEHKRNLVSQNTYNIDNTVSYNTANIAKDIMSVCENDDSLFDLCLFDVYFNLNYDRLANMDGIFYGLKVEMKSLDENNPLHTKLNDYKSFLEYAFNTAVSNGYLEVGSKDYKEILNAVNNYHQYHFNELSDSDQKAIRELLDNIKEIKTNMGNTKLDELSKLVTDREINSKKGEGRGA